MATSCLSSVAASAVRAGGAVAKGGGSSSGSTVSGVHFSGSRRADQQWALVGVGNRGRASRGAVTLVGTGKCSFGGNWKANGTMESVAKRASELNAAVLDDAVVGKIEPAILLTEKATMHLKKLKAENDALCLRIGVRQGGCSGMSYIMDFEDQSKLRADDSVIEADGIKMVCDPKSLLFLFGMQLDYSDALIGGGFSFQNPNATSSCGCGKSFAA